MAYLRSVQPSRRFLRLILILATASVLLVLVVLYFSLSQARITLFPKEEPAQVDYEALIDASKTFDPAKLDQVPGRIETVDKEGSKEVAGIGEKPVPDYAHVTVTIYNQQGSSQGLLPQTQLVTDAGIKFRTDASVNVPGGGSVQVGATADQPGKEYNIGPSRFSIIKLSPSLQQLVYAESKETATGGERNTVAVLESDITAAQDALIAELEQQGQEELRSKLSATEQFVPEAIIKNVVEKTSSVPANTETDKFTVTVKVQLATVVFDENSLLQLSIAKLTASLPEQRELVSYDPTTFNYQIASFDQKKGTAKLTAKLAGVARPRLSNELFEKERIRGLSKGEVIEHYQQFPDIDHVETSFTPFWLQNVPSIVDKVTIEVGKSESAAEQQPINSTP
jgi:hypothetical protein